MNFTCPKNICFTGRWRDNGFKTASTFLMLWTALVLPGLFPAMVNAAPEVCLQSPANNTAAAFFPPCATYFERIEP